jgi:hypothetical protein
MARRVARKAMHSRVKLRNLQKGSMTGSVGAMAGACWSLPSARLMALILPGGSAM